VVAEGTVRPSTRFVRADEVHVGERVTEMDAEYQVLRVRDLADGRLGLTLRPGTGDAFELRVPPWTQLTVVDG
jgi:hypothetical protein